jgi:hypothetical protein
MRLVTPTPATLCLTLKSRDSLRSAHIRVRVETEQSLGSLRTVVEELLASSTDVDARVELEVAGQPGLPIRVERFRWPELTAAFGQVSAPHAVDGSQAVARMIDEPRLEYALKPISTAEARSWRFPPELRGTCLAYLRSGADVVSRPVLVSAVQPAAPCASDSIRAAVRLVDQAQRQAALAAVFERMASDARGDRDDRIWIVETICSLRGLPATTFDALKELARNHRTLAHLLVSAGSEEEQAAIFDLEHHLPFLWLALPVQAWRAALSRRYEDVTAALAAALPNAHHVPLAINDLRQRCDALVALEPALEGVLPLAGVPAGGERLDRDARSVLLRIVARDHINRTEDHEVSAAEDARRFADRLSAASLRPPEELLEFHWASHGGLLAPCLLAASAADRLRLDADDLPALRRWLRDDPDYVSRAYGLVLPHYLR